VRFCLTRVRAAAAVMALCVVVSQCVPVLAEGSAGDVSTSMNLSTIRKSATAPDSLTGTVTIVNGGREKTVTAGMALTPAQLVAVTQIMATGTQSILLGLGGNATGGSVTMNASQNISSLRVPQGVTVVRDFGTGSPLTVTGNFSNAGTFYAVSTNEAVSNAVISARNISNSVGGLITTKLPDGLLGLSSALSNLSLSLIAANNITNSGEISSAGNLNLIAGNQIINSGMGGTQAVMSAVGNVNLAALTLVNSGLIQSSNANIVIVQQVARNAELAMLAQQLGSQGAFAALSNLQDLSINNTGGVLEALNGSITIDHAGGIDSTAVSVVGGDLLSQTVDVNAGGGKLSMNVHDLTGTLNVTAGCASVVADTPNLMLGNANISGDPLFASTGDFTIHAGSMAEPFTFIAGKNIIISDSIMVDSQGTNITIVAGAAFTNLANGVKVTGPSGNGGIISCPACVSTSTFTTSAAGGGGNILLAAYSDTGGQNGGNIDLSHVSLVTSSSGQAGSVTIIAPNVITINNVTMNGTTGAPKLTVTTAQPSGSFTADSSGNVTGALKPGKTSPSGEIQLLQSAIVSALGGIVTMVAGNTINLQDSSTIDVSGNTHGGAGGTVALTSGNDVLLSAMISAKGIDADPGGSPGAAGFAGGQGGSVTISAVHDVLNSVPGESAELQLEGGIGGLGIDASAGSPGGAGGAGGKGGTVTITAGRNVGNPDVNLPGPPTFVVDVDATGGGGGGGGDGAAGTAGGSGGIGGIGG